MVDLNSAQLCSFIKFMIVCGIIWLLLFVDSPEKAYMKYELAWSVQEFPYHMSSICENVLN